MCATVCTRVHGVNIDYKPAVYTGMDESSALSGDALEDIAYLARSENRVRVLEVLTTQALQRRNLEAETGVSRTTLGRILGEFEDRGWAERTTDGEYTATPRGKHVIAEFTPVVEAMETIRHLGESVAQLPSDDLTIGLEHFRDATVSRPEPNAPLGVVRRLVSLLEDAGRFRSFTYLAPPVPVGEAMYEGIRTDRLTAEHVLAGGLIEYLQNNPDGPPPWEAYIDAGARVYRYQGHIPCNLFVIDETVIITNDHPTNEYIETANDTVGEWAADLIDTYRDDADRVDADSLT